MSLSEKLKERRYQEIWDQYCGFLDLSIEDYMKIQYRLMEEQMRLWSGCELGRSILKGKQPKTIEEFRKELIKRYAEFYIDPQVSADYVPTSEGGTSPYGSVLVSGCVGQPGIISIPATRDLSLYQAIQQAGGTGQWANRGAVRLTRKLADGSKQQVLIDLDEIGANGASELNVLLMPGDVVDVPESNW